MAKTNKEILNAIREEASAEYKERIPEVKSMADMPQVLAGYEDYPSAKAEFINALTAKIFKTVVMNKVWNNPLVMLKKGEIPYGQGIEQLFVELAEKKDFTGSESHFTGGTTEVDDLLKKHTPKVLARFIQRNFAYKYKVSLSNQRLRNAFSSEGGVASLIDGLVASVMTSANNEEFKDMLGILNRKTQIKGNRPTEGLGPVEKGIIQRIADTNATSINNTTHGMYVKLDGSKTSFDEHKLVELIRTYASELSFLSNKYNLAGVNTACQPEDLVLFTTSDVVARLDVHVIASAFNVSAADVNVRIIKVPMTAFERISGNWGTGGSKNVTPIAVLADKDAIQQYDTLIESGSFYNPDQLMTNMFVHRQGITASCDYAQTIVFGVEQ